jgi:hypothetical protein
MGRVVSIKVQVSSDADFRWLVEWRKVMVEISACWAGRADAQ